MFTLNNYFEEIKAIIDNMPMEPIERVLGILHDARLRGRQIFIMGNGGSASTASHFACDLAKRTRHPNWPSFRVIGLTDNMAIFSAYANDEGYDTVFAEQLNNLIRPSDVVIGISCSGNSLNVIRAIELANSRGAMTVAFTALSGGKLKDLAQVVIHVPTNRVDQAEDVHLMLEHMLSDDLYRLADTTRIDLSKILAETQSSSSPEGALVRQLFGQPLALEGLNDLPSGRIDSPELLKRISDEFASKLDLHDLLSRILGLTVNYVGAMSGSIVVLDEKGEVVDGASAYQGEIEHRKPVQLAETVEKGLAGWVVEHKLPALVENTEEDPRWLRRGWETSRSAVCVPLMTRERVIGVLTLTRMQTKQFTMEDLSLLTAVTLTLSYSFSIKPA